MDHEHQSSPFDLFQWLPSVVQGAFGIVARKRRCVGGETIYQEGDPGDRLYRVVSGAVRLSVARSDGRELIYLLFEPGDCFGVSGLIDGGPMPQTAEAAQDTELQVVGRADFARLRQDHREFDDALLKLVTCHMRLLSGLFADAHLKDLNARVVSRILATARSFGIPGLGDGGISIHLSQGELALMAGGSRQSINQILRQLQESGLVQLTRGRMVIPSLAALATVLDG